jgi:hypothetical protein
LGSCHQQSDLFERVLVKAKMRIDPSG